MRAAAFIAHPYHWPVVGWPSDIEAWTMDDLRAHYKTGYAPNNCVMVVVGDVTDEQVMALAKKYIEPIPSQPPPPPVRTKEPEQIGERRVTVRKAGAACRIQLVAFHIPDAKSPDTTVLEVIDALLTAGQSSRLYSRMVDRDQTRAQRGRAGRSVRSTPALHLFHDAAQRRRSRPNREGAVRRNRKASYRTPYPTTNCARRKISCWRSITAS